MDPTQYARWFRASTPYISAHRGKTFVVLVGGDAVNNENINGIVADLALLAVLGVRVVLVHGARPQIEANLDARGLNSRYAGHRRVTDPDAIAAVEAAAGQVRAQIEGLFTMGLPNTPLHNTRIDVLSGNLVTARPLGIIDGVDHLFTGTVRHIRTRAINRALDTGAIVLLSPFGYSPSGEAFNLSSEELAAETAIALNADKLIVLDREAPLTDDSGEPHTEITPGELATLIDRLALSDVTRLRVGELLRTARAGVPRCHLISYSDDGALLQELFTAEGSGTQISDNHFDHVRRASAADVASIVELIRPLEATGALVRRSRDRLEQEVDRFFVAELDGFLVGCCALYPFGDAAELACLAIHPRYRAEAGHGAALVKKAEVEARRSGATQLFALTTQARDWFVEQGFSESSVDDLPAPKQSLYNYQRNAKVMSKPL
jgi:amino-acid N-acetyltransferase